MQRGDTFIGSKDKALMELLRRCDIAPLAIGETRRVTPGVLQPLFGLGITTLEVIVT